MIELKTDTHSFKEQDNGILSCQSTYKNQLTIKERKTQKKVAQELHKKLNKIGIPVQLKGINNDRNESVIAIKNQNNFILVSMECGLNFMISEDREGNCIEFYYDTENHMINDYFEQNMAQQKLF